MKAKPFNRSSDVVLLKYVLRTLKVKNVRSTVAVDTGRTVPISNKAEIIGYISSSHDINASTIVEGEFC